MELLQSWTSPLTYTYSKNGPIPDTFVKINAILNPIQTTGSSVSYTTSGIYTIARAKWNFQDAAKLAFDWNVSGSDTLTTISLPPLSPSMKKMFPTLSPDSLKLYQFELIHFPSIKSYADYLEKSFNPASPGKINTFESSAVRMQIN
jgi:hypothetical protein